MVGVIIAQAPGGPEVLAFRDVELPPPGKGEAQIRQHAIGVNFIDIYRRRGDYPAKFPLILGEEGAGEVLALGPGVTEVKPGDRVAYVGPIGGYAEARNVPAASLIRLPDDFSYEAGATMMLK
ncbi:MAG TPA: alcohol dehydrogenase catalytic domain-containing protein, partial [Methylocystis sp.]|nr:alcohol dehydrogenase catalytic domain-containing protein [Methylocystis sp.]